MNKLIKITLVVGMLAIQAFTLKAYNDECTGRKAAENEVKKVWSLYNAGLNSEVETRKAYDVCLAFQKVQIENSIKARPIPSRLIGRE